MKSTSPRCAAFEAARAATARFAKDCMTRKPLLILFLGWALMLTACETPDEPDVTPQLSFADRPLMLDVARIEIQKLYTPPLKLPHVEHEMPVSLLDAAENWAKQRLRAVGTTGTLRLMIDRASVVETRLKKSGGVTGLFTNDQAERYDGALVVRVNAFGGAGKGTGEARAEVQVSRTIAEDATVVQRERLWSDLTESLIKELDKVMEARIRRHLAAYLR
jgi:hypothetical protein